MNVILTCSVHRLNFNRAEGCPDCAFEARIASMSRLPKEPTRTDSLKYRCECGSRCIRPEGCTRNGCARRFHYFRIVPKWRKCANCGGNTKYDGYCTRYACRQVAGTMSMYNRRR